MDGVNQVTQDIGVGIKVLVLVTQKLFGVFLQMDCIVSDGVALISVL